MRLCFRIKSASLRIRISLVCVCVSALSCVRFHSDPAVLDHQKKVQYVKPVVAAPVNARNSKAGKRQKPNADVANVVMIE